MTESNRTTATFLTANLTRTGLGSSLEPYVTHRQLTLYISSYVLRLCISVWTERKDKIYDVGVKPDNSYTIF